VYTVPTVEVLSTGDELVPVAEAPTGSQIRDTNGPMLSALVHSITGRKVPVTRIRDDYQSLVHALDQASRTSGLVIVSGGASVGDKDYVGKAVAELGTVFFHGVKIRPGKPTLFGKIGNAIVFGLPGNPASSFVCFELFVREAMMRLKGSDQPAITWLPMQMGEDHKAMGREDFVRGRLESDQVVSVGEQGSFGIVSPALADFLIRFPADRDVATGEMGVVAVLR
jgi:molybdopterin molybdotransferase